MFDRVRDFINSIQEMPVKEVELEFEGVRLRVKFYRPVQAVSGEAMSVSEKVEVAENVSEPQVELDEEYHVIRSPIVGTFYRAPAPGAEPFVKEGDFVEKGQTLCIIEALKVMNEIESDISGKVVKILVDNGSPVEYGQPLFYMEKV